MKIWDSVINKPFEANLVKTVPKKINYLFSILHILLN